MALVTVYDPEGVAHQKEPVDVKECIAALGWTREPKPVEVIPVVVEAVVESIEIPAEKPVEVKPYHGKR